MWDTLPTPGGTAQEESMMQRCGGASVCAAVLALFTLLTLALDCRAQVRVGGGGGSTVGYIDGAVLEDQIRLRFDAAYDNHRPRRADFFWAKSVLPESRVDDQQLQLYVEKTVSERCSAFVELPTRFLNPEQNDNATGLGDICLGGKYLLSQCDDALATFQLRVYLPTGDEDRGLGNGHVTIEPGLLLFLPIDERFTLEGELRYWIPVGGTEFAGSILRYGVGISYRAWEDCTRSIRPVAEFVAWTVLDGKEIALAPSGVQTIENSAGDTIVNAKLGVRACFCNHELYAGYGRPLTGDRWYENVWRLEWRVRF
jgi:outer membrane putative beta-barrel porin/alpha-amylase